MKSFLIALIPCFYFFQTVNAQFSTPDTVCLNTPVTITNTSSGASSYYWNFCVADINTPPTAVNIGNPGYLSAPVFMDYVYTNNNYYAFVSNYSSGNLVRLDFGNSLLNTPTSVNLGNYGGILQASTALEGIQVVQNEGRWYAIIVGGNASAGTQPRIVKIDFGASITNPGVATNWGNIGNLAQSIDLHVFKEGNNWYGLTVNSENNTITRFNFTNSFTNTPTAVNLGNLGGLQYPTGIFAINDNGFWRVFITNGGDNLQIGTNSSITRLDFGSSLLNTPTAVNLGNPGGKLHHPRDLTIMKFCGQITGFAVNGNPSYYDLVRLNFNNDLSIAPTATSLGNTGNYSFPHSISKLFRVNDDVYAFITNVANNTISRLRFAGCTNASVSSSTAQNPAPVTYSTPGTYNINLTIDDGLPTQASFCRQVVVVAPPVHTPTKTYTICSGNAIKIGTGVKYAKYTWNTGETTDSIIVNAPGTYWVQTDLYGCTNRDSMTVTSTTQGDYTYKIDVCNPLSVQFVGTGVNLQNPYWSFGDGNTTTGSLNTSHTYAAYGNYTVKFGVENGTCKDTITKNISINLTQSDIIFTPDTTICFNATGQLRAYPALSFCWSPTTYLNNPNIPNPVTSTPGTMTYYYTAAVPGNNLITNGDFSNGNTGFNSSYLYTTRNITQGEFFVGPNPQSWNALMGNCTDHTTGNGNMLLVNGAPQANVQVWSQNITVTPNTNYAFSTWLQNINVNNAASNPPNLQFSINGNNIGNNLQGRNAVCAWDQFYTVWNSGNNTTATIAIVNQNTVASGNDYALDDISFAPVFIQRDSVIVTVDTPLVKTINDTTICKNTPVPLQATGAATWSWSPATGLSDATISNPIATPLSNTQYIVTGTNVHGCTAKDTVQINLFSVPVILTSHDTIICPNTSVQLSANPALASWTWTPPATLSNPVIADPVAAPTATTTYTVAVKDGNSCDYTDTIRVALNKMNITASVLNATICQGDSTQLSASGGVTYQWSPASGVSNTSIANPKAAPAVTTDYKVIVTDATGCIDSATVQVVVKPVPVHTPVQSVSFCTGTSLKIGTGIQNALYTWNTGNSNQDSIIVNTAGTYWVQSEVNGCSNKDSITVTAMPNPVVNLGPDITDCQISNLVLDAGNAGGQYLWQDGSITQTFTANSFGKYYVQVTDGNGCMNSDTINLSKTTARLGDFTYKIDACNPLSVQFAGTGSNLQNPYWNFGDGNTTTGNFSTSHTYPAYGDYTVKFGVENGTCKDTIIYNIAVRVTPANIILTTDTTICFNTSKQLQATPSQNFCWSPTTYLNNPNIPNPVTSTQQTITYYYTAEINGAILRDSVTISADTPIVKSNRDTTICKGGFVQLKSTGAATWSWSPVTGLSNAAISNPVAAPTTNTDYIVTGTTINGCSAKDTVTLTLYPVPTVISNHDITDCPNTPVQLAANPALTSWSWSPAATLNNTAIANPVATPGVNTKYLVTVTDANNCNYTDSVNVQLLFTDFKVSIMGGAICKGESVNLKASGGDSYLWSPAGSLDNVALSSPTATPESSTLYSVYIKENSCNNDTTISVMVVVKPAPLVTAEKTNDLDCVTHSTRLSATGSPGNTYLWSPASGLDHPNSPNPVSTTDTTIRYVVAGTKDGCTTLDSVTVYVTSTGKVTFEVPNAFTPNGDGRNDCFGVKSWGDATIEEFAIFNRWGQKVYSSNKTNPCWDGRFNGEPQPSGGYVYVIKAKTYCGTIKRTGTLMLVR